MSNLIPLNQRTEDEQRKIASAGGKASGKARALKKRMKDMLQALIDKETPNGTYREQMCIAIMQKAANGDVRAFETIRDTLGEKPEFQTNEVMDTPLPSKIIIQPVKPIYKD